MGRYRGDRPRRRRDFDRPGALGRPGLRRRRRSGKGWSSTWPRSSGGSAGTSATTRSTSSSGRWRPTRRSSTADGGGSSPTSCPTCPTSTGASTSSGTTSAAPRPGDASPTSARAWPALREAGFPVRIASNFDGRLRAVAAGLPELAGFVETLVISSEVGYRKPHPAFYHAACASLGLPPDRVLCVGDDPENDVRAPSGPASGVLLDRDGRRPPGLATMPGLLDLAGPLAGARGRPGFTTPP